MADEKLSKPAGILPGAPPSKPVRLSQDAIDADAPPPAPRLPSAGCHSANGASEITWAIGAGAVFALVRFLVVWPIVNPFGPYSDGLEHAIGRLPWIAAASAGLSGALLWWLFGRRQSFVRRGAMAGLLAALFSYVGIGLFGGDPGFWFFAPAATGWIVFPVLAVVGVLLSRLQQDLTR